MNILEVNEAQSANSSLPSDSLTQIPYVEESTFGLDMSTLLENGDLHDVIFKVSPSP